jgi:hypothetical protein
MAARTELRTCHACGGSFIGRADTPSTPGAKYCKATCLRRALRRFRTAGERAAHRRLAFREAKYRLQAKGLCARCSLPRGASPSRWYCKPCLRQTTDDTALRRAADRALAQFRSEAAA